MIVEGLDVSNYQGWAIDWQQVRAAGKRFVAVKATEGTYYEDPTFARNWAGAYNHGLIRWAYHYFRPNEDGAAQADYFHAYVRRSGRFRVGDGAILDVEQLDGQDPAEVIAGIEKWIRRMLHTTQAGLGIYTYPDFWLNKLLNPSTPLIDKCTLWLADYGSSVPVLRGWPNGLSVWQYSETGHCPGIFGSVDLDRFYGSPRDLSELARLGGRS